jgi:group I intron endonuclease
MINPQIKSGIYCIENVVNGKIYIGSSVDINHRWKNHQYELNNDIHHSKHLQAAWNKYGEQSFEFKILEIVNPSKEELLEREQWWIDITRCDIDTYGYNILSNAGRTTGYNHSEESRMKISNYRKGKRHTQQTKDKISSSNMGRTFSEESRKKISESNLGKKCPKNVELNKSRAKTWSFVSPDGTIYNIKDLVEFCRENGLTYSLMTLVYHGKRKSHKGWMKCLIPC